MTRLSPLRSQLAALRRTRLWTRWGTGYAALGLAVLWVLAALFGLDVLFQLNIPQRVLLLLTAIGLLFWAFVKLTRPFLGRHEDDLDMALMVERQHQIDSDLVAALQFEQPVASQWGSPQLETAVIDYVAQLGNDLDVYQGFSRQQLARRTTLLSLTLVASLVVCACYPAYVRVFFNRLFLGSWHYPTATTIQQIVLNGQKVLEYSSNNTIPRDSRSPQGQPLSFVVKCSGQLPDGTLVRFTSGTARGHDIELQKLTLDQRLARLQVAESTLVSIQQDDARRLSGSWQQEITAPLTLDAPKVLAKLHGAATRDADLAQALTELRETMASWPNRAGEDAVYAGQLPRLVDGVAYKVYAGDAWTDAAHVSMIALPIIQLKLEVDPPEYAKAVDQRGDQRGNQRGDQRPDPAARHLAILEGSKVKVAIEVMNDKRLAEAWISLASPDGLRRFPLVERAGSRNRVWELTTKNNPFSPVQEELRFDVQVRDIDGMSLDRPLQGLLRLRSDRPPTGSVDVVHRVVLPNARPVIEYRANDDYGIGALKLWIDIERQAASRQNLPGNGDEANGEATNAKVSGERKSMDLVESGTVVLPGDLPLSGRYPLELASLNLMKGDRLKIALEITDYRGQSAGESYTSDAIYLEVSDESGVYAAILEADQKSEKHLTDIIQRELGIGESQ